MLSTALPGTPAAVPLRSPTPESPSHLVDATMFWSAAGGGVGRYLRSKQGWVEEHAPAWRHTLLVPGEAAPGRAALPAPRLPFSDGYRFPIDRRDGARRIVGLRADVIEVGDPYRLAWSALDAGWRLGVPVAAFAHSNVAELARRIGGRWAQRAVRRYLRRLYRQFDTVFAASQWMVGELRGIGVDRVVHQPIGVDCAAFHPRRGSDEWRARLGLSPRDCVLVYAGRFAPEKNLQVLADAVRRLGPRHALVAIGAGPAAPQGARVIRLPYQSDPLALATALASADLFVHAGDQETYGLAVLESLACGTPVVASAFAGMRDFVDNHTVIGLHRICADRYAEVITSIRPALREMRDPARVRALQFDHRITFARQFARYAALRGATTFGEAAPEGAAHGT